MNPEAQWIAIAEACGWEECIHFSPGSIMGLDPFGREYERVEVPDYLNDLNACHEMEKVLTKDQKLRYQEELYQASAKHGVYDGSFASWHYIHATAAQRCEAFLRTIGKWSPPTSASDGGGKGEKLL